MKITKLEIQNVKMAGRMTFEPGTINVISGPNSCGKTAVIDGIILAITGGHPIGKTGQKVMQMCPVDASVMAAVVTMEDGETHAAQWQRSKSGSVKQTIGKANAAIYFSPEQFFEASQRGRFGMLAAGSEKQAEAMERAISELKDELAANRSHMKRLTETNKTLSLELSETRLALPDPDEREDLIDFLMFAENQRSALLECRNIIGRIGDAGRMNGLEPIPKDARFAEMTEEELVSATREWQSKIENIKAIERTLPTAEQLAESIATRDQSLDTYQHLSSTVDEWKALGYELEDLEGKHAKAVADIDTWKRVIDAFADPEPALNPECVVCPSCRQSVQREQLTGIQNHFELLQETERSIAESLEAARCPVSASEFDQARQRLADAQNRAERFSAARSPDALLKVSVLPEYIAALSEAFDEATRRRINGERKTYAETTARMEKLRQWFTENDAKIAAATKYEALRDQVALNDVAIEACDGEIATGKAKIAAQEQEYATFCANALFVILEQASGLMAGIVDGAVTNYGTDVVIERAGAIIQWSTMSGSERLAIGLAVKAAISSIEGIVLVDEFGVLTPENQKQLIENLRNEIEAGRIDQAFIVQPIDSGHAVEMIEA